MAHFLRLKLHALCSTRLSSRALVSKLLKSPDPRLTSWRWYGEGALLEDHGVSTSETDGGSMTAIQEDWLAKESEGIKGGVAKKLPASHNVSSLDSDSHLESSLGRLTNLVSDKSEANSNILHVGKGSMNQTQSDQLSAEGGSKSAKDDKWKQMMGSIRSMALKKKIKAGDANNSGSTKVGQSQSELDFSDLDLPQAGGQSGVSQGPTVSNRELPSLTMNTSNKSIKQRNSPQLQSSNQQKSKDITEKKDRLNLLVDIEDAPLKPRDRSSQYKNQQRNKPISSFFESEDDSLTSASEECDFHDGNQLVRKIAARERLDLKLPKGSDDASKSAKGSAVSVLREAANQASTNSDGISKQSYMVCVQNLPPSSNPSMVKSSMAVHGEVTGLFKKPVRERLFVYIQFKTAEAMESALAARKLQLGSKSYHITRAEQTIFTTVVRISKVSNDTDEGQLRTICEQYGKVDNVRKRSYGLFDVYYDVKELTNMPSILASLSEVNASRSTWLALPAPMLHPSVQKEALKSVEGQSWHDIQLNLAINRIEAGLDVVSVLFEDLKQLNSVSKEYLK